MNSELSPKFQIKGFEKLGPHTQKRTLSARFCHVEEFYQQIN